MPSLPKAAAIRSPVGAPSAAERLIDTLRSGLLAVPVEPGDGLLVAFSGGPDSTALLWGLAHLAQPLGLRLHAFHLDHRLDPDSPRRAQHACDLAETFGVPLTLEVLQESMPAGESVEAFARRRRYERLELRAEQMNARFVLTAHHRGDQSETVLLRWLFGSGLIGLAGIRPQRERLLRPLLDIPRREIEQALDELGLKPSLDPTNADLNQPRSRVRHLLLPHLTEEAPDLPARLARLAARTQQVQARLESRLEQHLGLVTTPVGAAMHRASLQELPESLFPFALALLARRAGAPYPPTAEARQEILRQLAAGGRLGCDCGHGFRVLGDGRTVRCAPAKPSPLRFAYTLTGPGTVRIPELRQTLTIMPRRIEPWMTRGDSRRAGFHCPDLEGRHLVVRNRRPGDRLQPLGSSRERRLKDVLIDHRVPRELRDRIPLLVIDETIVWVPGVALGEAFRLPRAATKAWVASLEDHRTPAEFARSAATAAPR